MTDRVDFLDLFGVDVSLLQTDDDRAVTLTGSDGSPFARIFIKKDGSIVLQSGSKLPTEEDDFRLVARH